MEANVWGAPCTAGLRVALVVSLAASACAETPPATGEQRADLLALVAQADEPGLGGFDELYVGRDASSELGLAVATTRAGQLVAYACDGESLGVWFTGAVRGAASVTLTSGTSELILPRGPDAASRLGDAEITLRTGGDERTLVLEPASELAGLHRFEDVGTDGRPVTVGWVSLNDGQVFGVDSAGGAVKSRPIVESELGDTAAVGGAGPGSVETDALIFNRFRCGRLVLRMSRDLARQIASGCPLVGDGAVCSAMEDLSCPDYGYGLPQGCAVTAPPPSAPSGC